MSISKQRDEHGGAQDLSQGALLPQIVRFAVPLFSSMVLQLTFHAADVIVVGRYASATAMGAVGSTSAVMLLFINVLLGLSTGASVITAQAYGAKDERRLRSVIHTAVLLAVVGGMLMGAVGIWLTPQMLALMKSPASIVGKATLYMRLCLLGTPCQLLYNFGSGIMRSLGDTKRPMYYLTAAGMVNVVLNLLLVIVFRLDVAGVAIATVASHALSSLLVVAALRRNAEPVRLYLSRLRIHPKMLLQILRIGLPSGFQGSFFTLSNVVIQTFVNSLGEVAVAGNSAVQSMEGLPYIGSFCFFHAALTFVGQNYGARNYARIRRSIAHCLWLGVATCFTIGMTFFLCGRQLLSIYTSDPEVIRFGMQRMALLYTAYWICSMMDTVSGALRGLGYSVVPSVIILFFVCGLRIGWCMTVFRHYRTLSSIMCSYPLSWFLATLVNGVFLAWLLRRRIAAELGGGSQASG